MKNISIASGPVPAFKILECFIKAYYFSNAPSADEYDRLADQIENLDLIKLTATIIIDGPSDSLFSPRGAAKDGAKGNSQGLGIDYEAILPKKYDVGSGMKRGSDRQNSDGSMGEDDAPTLGSRKLREAEPQKGDVD